MKAVKLMILGCLAVTAVSCNNDDDYIPPEEEYFPSAEVESFYIEPEDWLESEIYPGGWEFSISYPYDDMVDFIHHEGAVLVYLDRFDDKYFDPLPFTDKEEGATYHYYTGEEGLGVTIEPVGDHNLPAPNRRYYCKIVYVYADVIQAQGLSKQELRNMSLKEVESRFDVQAVTK